MSTKTKRFILPESEIPTRWYNVMADMPNKPMPPLNPATKQPLKASDLYPIFAEALADQEMNQTDPWIDIPDEVREQYKNYRCTPLVRAYGLEKALGTPAHIYFKNESVSPVGSHKLNSALAQAYYCKRQGVTNITTETGAGQWGAALSYAAKAFGLELAVYMVKISYEQKPYRRSIMQTFGAQVTASPSMSTKPDANTHRASEPSGLARHGDLGGDRAGDEHAELQIHARLGAEPRHAAPDDHRPRRPKNRWKWQANTPT